MGRYACHVIESHRLLLPFFRFLNSDECIILHVMFRLLCPMLRRMPQKMRTYDLRTARLVTEDASHPITSFSMSNDGASVAASCLDGIVRLWGRGDGDHRQRRRVFQKLHSSHVSNNYKVECAFTSNDEYVISGSECGAVAVYSVDFDSMDADDCGGGAERSTAVARAKPRVKERGTTLRGHKGPTCSVAACPQSSRSWLILSASYDGTAVVWASREQHDCCFDR